MVSCSPSFLLALANALGADPGELRQTLEAVEALRAGTVEPQAASGEPADPAPVPRCQSSGGPQPRLI